MDRLEWPAPQAEGFSEYLRFKTGEYRAVVIAGCKQGDDGEDGWMWQGMYAARDSFAVITAISPREDDSAWAEKVLRSVRR